MARSRNWMFTINNPSDDDEPSAWPGIKYLIYQAEQAKTRHYQGYVMFDKEQRISALKKLNARAHWEPRAGTHEQAVAYCSKLDTRVDGPWIIGEPPRQGKRTDLDEIKSKLDAGVSLKEISQDHFKAYLQYGKAFSSYVQLQIEDRTIKPTVVVHYGPPGVGKSTAVQRFIGSDSSYRKDPNHNWWEGYENQKHTVLDEFAGCIPFCLLKLLLDQFPVQVEVKNGHRKFTSEFVHIISNDLPEDWYDSRHNFSALHRRIDFMLEYSAIGVEPTLVFDHRTSPPTCSTLHCPARDLYLHLHPDEDIQEASLLSRQSPGGTIRDVPRGTFRILSPHRVFTSSQEEEFATNNDPNPYSDRNYLHPPETSEYDSHPEKRPWNQLKQKKKPSATSKKARRA
jgi:GTPase SAR1 family protein